MIDETGSCGCCGMLWLFKWSVPNGIPAPNPSREVRQGRNPEPLGREGGGGPQILEFNLGFPMFFGSGFSVPFCSSSLMYIFLSPFVLVLCTF